MLLLRVKLEKATERCNSNLPEGWDVTGLAGAGGRFKALGGIGFFVSGVLGAVGAGGGLGGRGWPHSKAKINYFEK